MVQLRYMILRIILTILLVGCGFLMVWKTVRFQEFMGRIDWAEEKLGPGGTPTFLKLVGLGFIFIGFMVMTNLHEAVLSGFASLFVRGNP